MHSDFSIDHKLGELKDTCHKKGMRMTKQRTAIFKELAKSKAHPDAEKIYESVKKIMPNISFDTVYRSLASLEDLGLIFRVDNLLPKARFDADLNPHHHFICIECNEVYDVMIDDDEKITIPRHAFEFGTIKDINLQIRGICNNCKQK